MHVPECSLTLDLADDRRGAFISFWQGLELPIRVRELVLAKIHTLTDHSVLRHSKMRSYGLMTGHEVAIIWKMEMTYRGYRIELGLPGGLGAGHTAR
jgi:hypothetical protein